MIIELKPMDTLFFKDGKPFSMGEETWADAIFPPYPATIYGALRTAWFSENIRDFEKLNRDDFNTKKDPTTKLKVKNIIIKKDNDLLFPMPRNILQGKHKENNGASIPLKRLSLSKKKYLSSAKKVNLLLNPTNKIYSYENSWIYQIDLKDYLRNDISNFESPINIKKLLKPEPKIGIARDNTTHSSKEGNLYMVEMLRLEENTSIIVEYEGIKINKNFFKLGGEGRFVVANKLNANLDIEMPQIDDKFLIYIATPAIFKKGWLPSWIDETSLTGQIPNTYIKVKLITMAIGKPKFIGGFDMAKRKPKPMYKAVPEGSVYFFEIVKGDGKELKKIHQKSISDIYPEQGFGICYIGKI